MAAARSVWVTGMGLVSPFGRGVETFWAALASGEVARPPLCLDYNPPSNLNPEARDGLGRATLLAADAAIQAVEDARLPFTAQTAPMIGAVFGSLEGDREKPVPGAPATSVARVLGIAGPVLSLYGPGSGLAAVIEGFELIARGDAPVVVVGATGSPAAPGADGDDAGRPFDARRNGVAAGEAACAFVLEDEEVARARQARLLVQALGGGLAFSRATVMRPGPNFIDAARAMRAALLRAEVFQGEVETVFSGAAGDRAGDEIEVKALTDLWGPNVDRLTVTSVLGAAGHAGPAAAVLSLAAAIASLERGIVPPAAGCTEVDEPFAALDIVLGQARAWRYNTAMVTGFSEATNAALVVRKSD
jgi:3-oxoacyl-[acyl-carrier-protein] synthase II